MSEQRDESTMGYMVWGTDLIAPVKAITLVDGHINISAEIEADGDVTPDHNDTVTVIGTDGSQIAHRERLSPDENRQTVASGERIGMTFNLAAVLVTPA